VNHDITSLSRVNFSHCCCCWIVAVYIGLYCVGSVCSSGVPEGQWEASVAGSVSRLRFSRRRLTVRSVCSFGEENSCATRDRLTNDIDASRLLYLGYRDLETGLTATIDWAVRCDSLRMDVPAVATRCRIIGFKKRCTRPF